MVCVLLLKNIDRAPAARVGDFTGNLLQFDKPSRVQGEAVQIYVVSIRPSVPSGIERGS
jgi:hypothetical protein